MSESIVDGTLFNAGHISYGAPKANTAGGKSVNINNTETRGPLIISTPTMMTWGASDFLDAATGRGNGKFDMSLQFPTPDFATPEAAAFLANMIAFEEKIKSDALLKSKEWFGKILKNAEVVEALYSPTLKYSKDKVTGEPDLSKAPILKVKLPLWEGIWRCAIYDEDDNKLFPDDSNPSLTPLEILVKKANVAIVMQCGGLWFANGKFGVTWKLVQAAVENPKPTLFERCYVRVKPSTTSTTSTTLKTTSTKRPIQQVNPGFDENAFVDDSDDEDASRPVPVPVPLPEDAEDQDQEQEQEQEKEVSAAGEKEQPAAQAPEEPVEKKRKIIKKKSADVKPVDVEKN